MRSSQELFKINLNFMFIQMIYIVFLIPLFYINLIDWDLIHTYFNFFILEGFNYSFDQNFIKELTKTFSTIYCSEVDSPINNINSENSSFGGKTEESTSLNISILELFLPDIIINTIKQNILTSILFLISLFLILYSLVFALFGKLFSSLEEDQKNQFIITPSKFLEYLKKLEIFSKILIAPVILLIILMFLLILSAIIVLLIEIFKV